MLPKSCRTDLSILSIYIFVYFFSVTVCFSVVGGRLLEQNGSCQEMSPHHWHADFHLNGCMLT